ncbi:MAG: hypothetical protein AAF799_42645 [Myxococcota bacterium]
MQDNSWQSAAWALGFGLLTISAGCDPNLAPEIPDTKPVPRVSQPVPIIEGDASRNLLQGFIERDPDVAGQRTVPNLDGSPGQTQVPLTWAEESLGWKLPFQAKRVVAALMIAAAHDRLDSLDFILTPEAQWGWPDPRRPGARSIFNGDDGEAFFQAFRTVAQRLPEKTKWTSKPVPPGIQVLHQTGAEPMWTYYATGQDGILMQLVLYQGKARIAYVGLYEEPPADGPPEVNIETYGPIPSLVPPRRPPPAVPE